MLVSFMRRQYTTQLLMWSLAVLVLAVAPLEVSAQTCERTVKADVVALDQVFFWNRLGAIEPQGQMFALRRDIVPIDPAQGLIAGNVQLRPDKRPRPIVLRMNVGDCLQITFQNLLHPAPVDEEQPATRTASIHVIGMQLVGSIAADGSNVGTNPSSLVAPGGTATYKFFAEREASYVLYSTAANTAVKAMAGS